MDQLLQALGTLFQPTDSAQHAAANQWLMSWQVGGAAWPLSLQLLRHPAADVAFFGASTLYTKVRNEWALSVEAGGLAPADQAGLMQQMMQELSRRCSETNAAAEQKDARTAAATSSKLALALCAMAVKTPSGAFDLLHSLLPAAGAPVPSLSSPAALILLEVLLALPEESDKIVGFGRMEEVHAQLRRQADAVLQAAGSLLREAVALRTQAQAQPPSAGVTSVLSALARPVGQVVSVFHSWRFLGLDLSALHSAGLLQPLGELYALALRFSMNHASDVVGAQGLVDDITEVWTSLVAAKSYPRANRSEAVEILLAVLLQVARPAYEQVVAECVRLRSGLAAVGSGSQQSPPSSLSHLELLSLSIARFSNALGEEEMDYLACGDANGDEFPELTPGGNNQVTDPNAPPANPAHQAYFEFHLRVTSHPYDCRVVELSLDVWSALQDQPVANRKFDFLKREIFVRLLESLLLHASYPPAFVCWGQPLQSNHPRATFFTQHFADDADSFRRFRGILTETFLSCQGILGHQFYQLLATLLQRPEATQDWTRVEAALSALIAVGIEIRDVLQDQFCEPHTRQAAYATLGGVMQQVWSLAPAADAPASAAPAMLLTAGCAFLKSFIFLTDLSPSPAASQELVERSVQFLLRCIPFTQTPPPVTAASASSSAPAASPFSNAFGASPQDAPDVAGIAFRALCTDSHSARNCILSSASLLPAIISQLFSTPGYSEKISFAMKRLWLEGMGALVTALAFSDASVSQVAPKHAGASSVLSMASTYLQGMATPLIQSLQQICGTLQGLGAGYHPSPQDLHSIREGICSNLDLLDAILNQISYPKEPAILQCKLSLLDRVTDLQPEQRPQSVAIQVFSACWPFLQQAVSLFAFLKDTRVLDSVLAIYSNSVSLLYPHEFAVTLVPMLQSAMQMYAAVPLPAVLKLIDKTVSTGTYGAEVELRDTWNAIIDKMYKLTRNNTRENFKSHTDLFDAFWDLCTSLYLHCTYCFICAPANSLPHILQFSVQILDSLSQQHSTVQRCLLFLDTLLEKRAAIDTLPNRDEVTMMLVQTWTEQGGAVIRQVMSSLSEKMPLRLDSRAASLLLASVRRFPELTRAWIEKGLLSDYFAATTSHLTDEDKHRFWSLAWPLQTNPVQWNAIWLQFSKICQAEDTMESLLSFELQRSGQLRGSPRDDAAFAAL